MHNIKRIETLQEGSIYSERSYTCSLTLIPKGASHPQSPLWDRSVLSRSIYWNDL
jgi:hypothetical protein